MTSPVTFERIVRPFQFPEPFRSRTTPQFPPEVGLPAVETTWEGSADAKWTEEEPDYQINLKAEFDEDKSKRVSHEVKVVNPVDETQHVFVERVDSFTFNNKQTNEELKLNFKWD